MPISKERNSVTNAVPGAKSMPNSEGDFSSFSQSLPNWFTDWELARASLQRFRQTADIDSFAQQHYKLFPKHPPDQFDLVLWEHPQKLRLYNRSGAKWKRTNDAVGPTGLITRLSNGLAFPTVASPSLKALGFTTRDSSYENYQDGCLIAEIKEAVKEQMRGSGWLSIEVNRGGVIHPHILGEHDAFDFDAFTELIYEPKGLFRYLIKGIPYNPENLAVFLKAKKALPKGKQLPRKTGTIRVPYSKPSGF